MADIVVDASVVAKWYVPERDHEVARALRDDYLNGRHTLLAPALLPFEVINALNHTNHFTADSLLEVSTTLPEYGIDLIHYRDLGPVAETATDLDITIYDASYLALAHTTGGTVYTADEQFLDAATETQYAHRTAHIREYPTS